jgi:hypothetical protein
MVGHRDSFRLGPLQTVTVTRSYSTDKVQHMSPVLPFEIIIQIIDVVGENKDTDLLKKLALVSQSSLQICSKYLFATVELHDEVSSSKKGFVKLLKRRPDVVKHIRKLTYNFSNKYQSFPSPTYPSYDVSLPPPILPSFVDGDPLLPPILPSFVGYDPLLLPPFMYNVGPNFQSLPLPTYPSFAYDDRLLLSMLPKFLRTISHLNCLTIFASKLDWRTLDSSLTSALLHLMHLPTINHIDLSCIENLPVSSLTPSVDLLRLDIFHLCRFDPLEDDDETFEIVQSEVMPKLCEFQTSGSSMLTKKLLRAKRQDGRPAFDLMNLRRLSLYVGQSEDEWNIRYLLQNAKLLEKLCLQYRLDQRIEGLYSILSPSARSLKVFDLTLSLHSVPGLCVELEAMAGNNVLEALTFAVEVDGYEAEDDIGSKIYKVEEVLIEPGWSALRQVTFKVEIACCLVPKEDSAKLSEVLQSLPDKYLNRLSKQLELNYSAFVVKCAF